MLLVAKHEVLEVLLIFSTSIKVSYLRGSITTNLAPFVWSPSILENLYLDICSFFSSEYRARSSVNCFILSRKSFIN